MVGNGISTYSGASPTVTGNTITGSGGYGIYFGGGGGVCQGNTIQNNGYGIYIAYTPTTTISNNTFANNSSAEVYATGTVTSNETWWGKTGNVELGGITIANGGSAAIASGRSIKVHSDTTVSDGGSLDLGSGNQVLIDANSQLYVYGTLKATGATFTWSDGVSQWRGIQFNGAGSSGSRLDNCVLKHVVSHVIYMSQSSATITGCTISQSTGGDGIAMLNGSSPVISNNTISGMVGNGISTYSGASPTVTGNTITGNIGYGLYNSGSNIVIAQFNNWGDPSGPLDDSDDRATGGWYNPNGKGNKVSDHVNYFPWTGTTITSTATPTGLSGAPRNASINLTWDANTEPSLGGYKIYYGATSGSYGAPIMVGKVTSYKLPGLTNGAPYYLAISSLNTVGAESALTTEITVTPVNKYAIDLTFAGTGDGSVLITQGGTACNTNCSPLFDPSTAVTIKATPDQYSLFKGWSGDFTAASGDCKLTMDTDKAVTATFNTDKDHSVRIDLPTMKYYSSISAAYLAASAASIIKAWGTDFTENLLFKSNIAITLKGGYNAGYTSSTGGATTLHGTLTVGKGSLTVENLVVQ
jgi:parallel beta-helix repeat protein